MRLGKDLSCAVCLFLDQRDRGRLASVSRSWLSVRAEPSSWYRVETRREVAAGDHMRRAVEWRLNAGFDVEALPDVRLWRNAHRIELVGMPVTDLASLRRKVDEAGTSRGVVAAGHSLPSLRHLELQLYSCGYEEADVTAEDLHVFGRDRLLSLQLYRKRFSADGHGTVPLPRGILDDFVSLTDLRLDVSVSGASLVDLSHRLSGTLRTLHIADSSHLRREPGGRGAGTTGWLGEALSRLSLLTSLSLVDLPGDSLCPETFGAICSLPLLECLELWPEEAFSLGSRKAVVGWVPPSRVRQLSMFEHPAWCPSVRVLRISSGIDADRAREGGLVGVERLELEKGGTVAYAALAHMPKLRSMAGVYIDWRRDEAWAGLARTGLADVSLMSLAASECCASLPRLLCFAGLRSLACYVECDADVRVVARLAGLVSLTATLRDSSTVSSLSPLLSLAASLTDLRLSSSAWRARPEALGELVAPLTPLGPRGRRGTGGALLRIVVVGGVAGCSSSSAAWPWRSALARAGIELRMYEPPPIPRARRR